MMMMMMVQASSVDGLGATVPFRGLVTSWEGTKKMNNGFLTVIIAFLETETDGPVIISLQNVISLLRPSDEIVLRRFYLDSFYLKKHVKENKFVCLFDHHQF